MDIETIAIICHEAIGALKAAQGDYSQKPWGEAPEWQRESTYEGIKHVINNPDAGPEFQHQKWMEHKLSTGWKWGREKNAEDKMHPLLVPFDELPEYDKAKDVLFMAIVRALRGYENSPQLTSGRRGPPDNANY